MSAQNIPGASNPVGAGASSKSGALDDAGAMAFSFGASQEDRVGAFISRFVIEPEPAAHGSKPLRGLSCGVKDLFDIAGLKTGFGNPTWLERAAVAERHASVVDLLLQAGVALVGKTHTDELAFSLTGQNHHYGSPVNTAAPDRIVGGSSSGSAAAVAAGLCDFALGTDTGGSVRAPASFCGLYGIRPTHDSVSREGVCELASSFDTVGWFTRSAPLLTAIGRVLLPADDKKRTALRRGVVLNDTLAQLNDSDRVVFIDQVERLCGAFDGIDYVSLGCGDRRTSPDVLEPQALDEWFDVFRTLQFADIGQGLAKWIAREKPQLGPGIAERMAVAANMNPAEVGAAAKRRRELSARIDDLLGDDSVIIMPTVPGAAPLRSESIAFFEEYRRTAMRLLSISGLSSCPQLSLPLMESQGAPFGFSIMGSRDSDLALLELGERLARV
jgi:amidase